MAKKRYESHIKWNEGETRYIDELLETGLYGRTRADVIKRLVDQGLAEKLNSSLLKKHGKKR